MLPPLRSDIDEATRLMLSFAERTGLVSGRAGRRYLWTDAFAVCNFLGLARATGEARYRELALQLIEACTRPWVAIGTMTTDTRVGSAA